jgi:putative membrane protein
MLLFWLLVLAGIVALVRGVLTRTGGRSPVAPESPLEILKRRYAKGEIDKAEFEEKRKDILGS